MVSKNAVRLGGAYVEITADESKLIDGLHDAEKRVKNFSTEFAKAGAAFTAIGVGITAPMRDAVETFADFEKQMLITQAVTKASGREMKKLTAQAKELGATTSWTAAQVAEGMVSLGRMGFSNREIEKSITAVMDLGRALNVDVATASKELGAVMRQFGADASQAGHYADVLATATNGAAIEMGELLESMKYVGAAGNALGADVETVTALTMALRNTGVSASQAGTQLRSMFLKLQSPKNIKLFGEKFNTDIYDAQGRLRSLIDILVDAQQRASTMGDKLAVVARQMFGTLQAPAFVSLMKTDNLAEFRDMLYECDGAAEAFREHMESGLFGALKLIESATEAVKNELGEALEPTLEDFKTLVQDASTIARQFIDDHKELINILGKTGVAFTATGAVILAGTGIMKGFAGVAHLAAAGGTKIAEAWRRAGMSAEELRAGTDAVAEAVTKVNSATVDPLTRSLESAAAAAKDAALSVSGLEAEAENLGRGMSTPAAPYFAKRTDGASLEVAKPIISEASAPWLKERRAVSDLRDSQLFASVTSARNTTALLRRNAYATGNEEYKKIVAQANENFTARLAEIRTWGQEQYRVINATAASNIDTFKKLASEAGADTMREADARLVSQLGYLNRINHQQVAAKYRTRRFDLFARTGKGTFDVNAKEFDDVSNNRVKGGKGNLESVYDKFVRNTGDMATVEQDYAKAFGDLIDGQLAALDGLDEIDRAYVEKYVRLKTNMQKQLDQVNLIKDDAERVKKETEIFSAFDSRVGFLQDEYRRANTHTSTGFMTKGVDVKAGRGRAFNTSTPDKTVSYTGYESDVFALTKQAEAIYGRAYNTLFNEHDELVAFYTNHADDIAELNKGIAEAFDVKLDVENDPDVVLARKRLESSQARLAELRKKSEEKQGDSEYDRLVKQSAELEEAYKADPGNMEKYKAWSRVDRQIEKLQSRSLATGSSSVDTEFQRAIEDAQKRVENDQKQLDAARLNAQENSAYNRRALVVNAGQQFDEWVATDIAVSQADVRAKKDAAVEEYLEKKSEAEDEHAAANNRLINAADFEYTRAENQAATVNARVGARINEAKKERDSEVEAGRQKISETVQDIYTLAQSAEDKAILDALKERADARKSVAEQSAESLNVAQNLGQVDYGAFSVNTPKPENAPVQSQWIADEYAGPPIPPTKTPNITTGSGDSGFNFVAPTLGEFNVAAPEQDVEWTSFSAKGPDVGDFIPQEVVASGGDVKMADDPLRKLSSLRSLNAAAQTQLEEDLIEAQRNQRRYITNLPPWLKELVNNNYEGADKLEAMDKATLDNVRKNIETNNNTINELVHNLQEAIEAGDHLDSQIATIGGHTVETVNYANDYLSETPAVIGGTVDEINRLGAAALSTSENFTQTAEAINDAYSVMDAQTEATLNGEKYTMTTKGATAATQELGEAGETAGAKIKKGSKAGALAMQSLNFVVNTLKGTLVSLAGMAVSMAAWTAVMGVFKLIADYAHKTAEDMRRAQESNKDIFDKDAELASDSMEQAKTDEEKIDQLVAMAGSGKALNHVEGKRLDDLYNDLNSRGIVKGLVVPDANSPSGYRVVNAGAASAMKGNAAMINAQQLGQEIPNLNVGLYGLDPTRYQSGVVANAEQVGEVVKDYAGVAKALENMRGDQKDILFGADKSWYNESKYDRLLTYGNPSAVKRAFGSAGQVPVLSLEDRKTREAVIKRLDERISRAGLNADDAKAFRDFYLRMLGVDPATGELTGKAAPSAILQDFVQSQGAGFLGQYNNMKSFGAANAQANELMQSAQAYWADARENWLNPYVSEKDQASAEAEAANREVENGQVYDEVKKALEESGRRVDEADLTPAQKQLAELSRLAQSTMERFGVTLGDDGLYYGELSETDWQKFGELDLEFARQRLELEKKIAEEAKKREEQENKKLGEEASEGYNAKFSDVVKAILSGDKNAAKMNLDFFNTFVKERKAAPGLDLSDFYKESVDKIKDVIKETTVSLSSRSTMNAFEAMDMSRDVEIDVQRQQLSELRAANTTFRNIFSWMQQDKEYKEFL